jgi:hypothetical protein
MKTDLETAYLKLRKDQKDEIERRWKAGERISRIACKASLTRSFVHSYVMHLNGKAA